MQHMAHRPIQFSLRELLFVVAACAVLLSGFLCLQRFVLNEQFFRWCLPASFGLGGLLLSVTHSLALLRRYRSGCVPMESEAEFRRGWLAAGLFLSCGLTLTLVVLRLEIGHHWLGVLPFVAFYGFASPWRAVIGRLAVGSRQWQ